jgi:L-ascorbate metabolism protein UlaG (beta-lactamase superfamily)
MFSMAFKFLFKTNGMRPNKPIPAIKPNLLDLSSDKDLLIWFGHSSTLLQIDSKRILIDPVFSVAASPVPFFNRAFKGTSIFAPSDMPTIDYLIISHDHWDHLDYPTVKALKPKTSHIICPLGVGEHFERWGFDMNNVIEMDWNEIANPEPGIEIICLPARHFSGRGLSPNQSLWASFMVKTPNMKIYIGGDSGYDTHFADIGNRFSNIDLAILENGQYGDSWKYIHMTPEQSVQAAKDLRAKIVLPVHNSKYPLGLHTWQEPLDRFIAAYDSSDFKLLTPMIGETIDLRDSVFLCKQWWKKEPTTSKINK